MIKLLIADDEYRTRKGLITLISQSNLPLEIVGVAQNGLEGLSMSKELFPDIILTDVRMPKLDGIKLTTEVRKFLPECQIIFISGYSDKEYLKSAIALKAVFYVEKPIDEQEILDALTSAIHIIEKNKKNNNIIEQKDFLLEKAALLLTSPRLDDTLLDRLEILYPAFLKQSCYRTLICQLSCPNINEDDNAIIQTKIKNALKESYSDFLFAQKRSNIFVIHVCENKSDEDAFGQNRVVSFYQHLQNTLSDFAESFLVVGNPVEKPEYLYHSYTNAVFCLRKLFFTGYNNICYYKKQENDIGTSFHPDSTVFGAFDQALKSGNCQEAISIVTNLFHKIQKAKDIYETNSIKNVYYQLLIHLSSICTERGFSDIFSDESQFIWENINRMDTIAALQEYLLNKLNLYAERLLNQGSSSLLVYRIQEYVEIHYHEADLSINRMADDLHFTPAYLCQIFKNETGTTINTYINTFRLKEAATLLKSRDVKLYEVSYHVGYNDSNYFSRQFKKHFGMTPSEFRKRNTL